MPTDSALPTCTAQQDPVVADIQPAGFLTTPPEARDEAWQADVGPLYAEARRLAGGLGDVVQRAVVYRHMYRFSGGNHVFPLLAAHGALWAGRWFRYVRPLARCLAWQHLLDPLQREACVAKFAELEGALRDINRRVCLDTYVSLHLTARHGDCELTRRLINAPLLEALLRVDGARRSGRPLSETEKQTVFETHFRNEQQTVVGPSVAAAVERFTWPLVRALALRPPIRFAYFPTGRMLLFRNFADREERVARGLQAYGYGRKAGWEQVEASLNRYGLLSRAACREPDGYFAWLRWQLAGATAE